MFGRGIRGMFVLQSSSLKRFHIVGFPETFWELWSVEVLGLHSCLFWEDMFRFGLALYSCFLGDALNTLHPKP